MNRDLIALTGDSLQEFIISTLEGIKECRDFVYTVQDYLSGSYRKALLVTGLRATGKTTGIMQAISQFDLSQVLLLFPASRSNNITVQDVVEILDNTDASIIVVDEFSWLPEDRYFTVASKLAGMVMRGLKVIITGTDSVQVCSLKSTELIHRAITVGTTAFSLDEYCRVYCLEKNSATVKLYLNEGCIFEERGIAYSGSLSKFIHDAILLDLVGYFQNFRFEVIMAAVYTILYDSVCNLFSTNGYCTPPVYRYTSNMLDYETFLDEFGIDPNTVIPTTALQEVADKLADIGVVVTLTDLRIKSHRRSYVTNPTLTAKLVKVIYNLPELPDVFLGHLYEAAVVSNVYMNEVYRRSGYFSMSYLFGRTKQEDYEIDYILYNRDEVYLFECKLTDNTDFSLAETTSLVKTVIPNLLGDTQVCGRFVVYNGEEKTEVINGYEVFYTSNWKVAFQDFRNLIKGSSLANKGFRLLDK